MSTDARDGQHNDVAGRLLGAAALGRLSGAEQVELDAHLTGCADCRAELAALTVVTGRLGALPAASALRLGADHDNHADNADAENADLSDRVLRSIAAERRREHRGSQLRQGLLAGAAAVAVLLAGVVAATDLTGPRTPAVPLESVSVAAPAGVDAKADLVAHTWGIEIKLAATGLADGAPYDVRVTTASGEILDAGAFLGTGERTLNCNLNASVLREDVTAFAVLDEAGKQVLTAAL